MYTFKVPLKIVLFAIYKMLKQSKCPSVEKWI